MSTLPPLAPPAPSRELLSWNLTDGDGLREIRTGLRRYFGALAADLAADPAAGSPAGAAEDIDDLDDVAQRIALVATELAGNALRHGIPPVAVRLLRVADQYILDVSDHDPDQAPRLAEPRKDVETGGRGLRIARSLTQQLCWHRDGGLKHVWASFPAPPARQGDATAR